MKYWVKFLKYKLGLYLKSIIKNKITNSRCYAQARKLYWEKAKILKTEIYEIKLLHKGKVKPVYKFPQPFLNYTVHCWKDQILSAEIKI